MFKDYNMFEGCIDDVLKGKGFRLIINGYDGLRYYKICKNTYGIPYAEAVEILIGDEDVIVQGFSSSAISFRRHVAFYEAYKPSLSSIEEAVLKAIEDAREYK